MGERADALTSHIRRQREELGDNIRELNFRMKQGFDWRHRVRENPVRAMIAAVIAGFVFYRLIHR